MAPVGLSRRLNHPQHLYRAGLAALNKGDKRRADQNFQAAAQGDPNLIGGIAQAYDIAGKRSAACCVAAKRCYKKQLLWGTHLQAARAGKDLRQYCQTI